MWKSLAQWLVHVNVSSRNIILRSSGWTSPPPGSHPGVILVSLCLSHAPPQPQEGMVLPLAHCCSPSMAGFVSIYFMWKSGTCENAYPGALRLVPQRCHSDAGLSSWSCKQPTSPIKRGWRKEEMRPSAHPLAQHRRSIIVHDCSCTFCSSYP